MLTDFRLALRTFGHAPGFTAVAVLTLALGIGATTAVFTVVDAVLLRPLPYAAADRLVVARGSLPDLRDLAAASQSFDGVGIWASNLYNLEAGGETQQVLGGVVSRELLPLLGVEPILGRMFSEDDARTDTVVVGYGLWQSRFGGDPKIVGQSIRLSGTPYTVVGITPAWFRFPSADFQLWAALGSAETRAPQQVRNRALRIFNAVARLRSGVTLQQAQAEAAAVSATLAKTYPTTNENITIQFERLLDRLVGDARPALKVLLATVGLLLLIACANVANLMLARTTVRERETAIRVALGAGRFRIVRHLAAESFTLALAGGALGVLVAMWGVDALPSLLAARLPRADGISINLTVLLFALGATLLTALSFGFAPVLQTLSGTGSALREGGRGVAGGRRGRRIRQSIIVVEVALAVIVLIGAGLMVRSFVLLANRDPGFDPVGLLSFNVQLIQQPNQAARARAVEALLERLSGLPGVEVVGGSTGFPSVTAQRGTRFALEGRTLNGGEDTSYFIAATPGYFQALHTRVLRGRAFDRRDDGSSPPVALINRRLSDLLFAGQDPVGRRLRLVNPEQQDVWRTIAGVVDDIHYEGVSENVPPTIYTPFSQTPFLWLYVMVRTNGESQSLVQTIRTVVPTVSPTLRAANLRPMRDVLSGGIAEPRLNMLLISGFALVALLLAAIGIYGVITYSVAQRVHEIGVRMALGARPGDVLRLVVREGVVLAACGTALGLAAATAVTRTMSALLFGVTPHDPMAFILGAVVLLVIASATSALPAIRATRVEPTIALRAE
jgi:putative ABC transport system permease protein